MTIYKILPNER